MANAVGYLGASSTVMAAGTAGVGVPAARLRIEMADKIYRLEPNNTPLVLLASKMNKKVTGQTDYRHLESGRAARIDTATASCASGGTTLSVTDGTNFRAGYMIRSITSGEIMRVTSVSTNDLTITRSLGGSGGTAAASIASSAQILIIGDSSEQGAAAPTAISVVPASVTNFTQIFKTPWSITDTAVNVDYYGEPEKDRLAFEAGLEHGEQIERAFWFGEAGEESSTSSGLPMSYTGGVWDNVSTNVQSTATLTELVFHDWMRTVFQYGSSEKWLFCSPLIISALDFWGITDQQLFVGDTTFGIKVKKWESSHGTVNIVNHKGFALWGYTGAHTTTAPAIAVAIDPDAIGYRYIANRDTHIVKNIQANNIDGESHQYLTECGAWIQNEKKHAILTAVSAYSA